MLADFIKLRERLETLRTDIHNKNSTIQQIKSEYEQLKQGTLIEEKVRKVAPLEPKLGACKGRARTPARFS